MHCTFQVASNGRPWRFLLLFSLTLLVGLPVPQPAAEDVAAIVRRWAEANRRDFEAAPRYSYFERIRNSDGTKTYAVTMLLGTPYKQLVLDGGQRVEDDKKLAQSNAAERARRAAESPDEHHHRLEDYQKDRERAHRILEEMPRAFDYRLGSTRRVNARTLYVLSATPRQGYDPPNTEARVLTGMRGEFWIDTQTYQLFRGWARVLHPVSIDGFLATVQPGTQFEVEQRPVGDGIWLPTHFSIHSRSSIVFLFHHRNSEDRTFFRYRKVSTS